MRVCVLANIHVPGLSVATTSTCTTKLEHFDEVRTRGKRNFKSEFFEMVFQLLEKITIYTVLKKLEYQIFRETTLSNAGFL